MSKSRTKASTLVRVRSYCLRRLGGNRCHRVHHRPIYNLLYRYVGYILSISRKLTPSHHTTGHSGVCLCDLMLVKC